MSRRLATLALAAEHQQVTIRTIRNWITAGYITGYRVPGQRGIFVDLDEVHIAVVTNPRMRTPRGQFGPKARIVSLEASVPVSGRVKDGER